MIKLNKMIKLIFVFKIDVIVIGLGVGGIKVCVIVSLVVSGML